MQTVPREKVQRLAKEKTSETLVSKPVRKRGRSHSEDLGSSFTDRLVDLVYSEYPHSKEEASVLITRVWNMVDQEITAGLFDGSTNADLKERVTIVSAFYDLAVQRLSDMNRPLLKYGAVAGYYISL